MASLDAKCAPLGPHGEQAPCLNNVLEARGMWHVYSVDIRFAKERCRQVDGWQQSGLHRLVELALMAGLDIPFNVAVERRPPEAVSDGAPCGVEALVAKAIIGITDEGEAKWWCDI